MMRAPAGLGRSTRSDTGSEGGVSRGSPHPGGVLRKPHPSIRDGTRAYRSLRPDAARSAGPTLVERNSGPSASRRDPGRQKPRVRL